MTPLRRERPRIALYSHDTMGLGHVRRNLLVARKLACSSLRPNILLLSGAIEARSFQMPQGVDCVTLPSFYKEPDGRYRPRRLRMQFEEFVSVRRKILRASIMAFEPDIFVVDTAPWGAAGELNSTLEQLASDGMTRSVLGVRDIWDDPEAVFKEWEYKRNWDAVRRFYKQVWVYGDPMVYDPVREYGVELEIARKFRFVGYIGWTMDLEAAGEGLEWKGLQYLRSGPYVLCMMGGGQDGLDLAEAFLNSELPEGRTGLLVMGPHMDLEDMRHLLNLSAWRSHKKVIDFVPDPIDLIRNAESIVSMGGYNAICEIMSFRKRALIVPRVHPRREQLIRAQRFQELGMLKLLHPEELEPRAITKFARDSVGASRLHLRVDMGGLDKVQELVESLLEGPANQEGMDARKGFDTRAR